MSRKDQLQTVVEYIEAQDEKVRPRLCEMRSILRSVLPDAEECISWSMPTYRKGKNIIQFAAFQKHLGLYPGGEATQVFAEDLACFDCSKGAIRFPNDRKLPAGLIAKIARWCYEEYAK